MGEREEEKGEEEERGRQHEVVEAAVLGFVIKTPQAEAE